MNGSRIFLVDDDSSVLYALSRLLREAGFDVEAYQSSYEFLHHYDVDMPGCAILDVALGDSSGLDVQRTLATRGDTRPVIFITGQGDVTTSVQAMKAGALDFLMKPVLEDNLLRVVRCALEQDRLSREESVRIAAIGERLASLTPREHEVLASVIAGRLNKQIAAELTISEKTVKVHRARVMAKMAVRSVAELVRLVQRASIPAGVRPL
jgi:FixJ family two-component response regulator